MITFIALDLFKIHFDICSVQHVRSYDSPQTPNYSLCSGTNLNWMNSWFNLAWLLDSYDLSLGNTQYNIM